ncbi:MAG: lipase family protein [Rhodopila sp.]
MNCTNVSPVPYGLLVMQAMDMWREKTYPPLPPPTPVGGGAIIGYVRGTDSIIPGHPNIPGPITTPVYYGQVVRRNATEVVVAIRGTDGYQEWLEDAQFPPVPYRPKLPLPPDAAGALVEQGFWGIYRSLELTDTHGKPIGPLAEAIPILVDPDDDVVVTGHSLGAPLATYLTLDLARGPLGSRVRGCYFASPRPGNTAFVTFFDQVVGSNYVLYNYLLDVVPTVPGEVLGYRSLSKKRVIWPQEAQADIKLGIGCSHHIVCYLAMLDYAATMQALNPVPAGEEGSVTCIRGPRTPGKPSVAQLLADRVLKAAEQRAASPDPVHVA